MFYQFLTLYPLLFFQNCLTNRKAKITSFFGFRAASTEPPTRIPPSTEPPSTEPPSTEQSTPVPPTTEPSTKLLSTEASTTVPPSTSAPS